MKKVTLNLKVSFAFYLFYFITFWILRDKIEVTAMIQTLAALTLITVFFHKVKSPYFIAGVVFSCAALYFGTALHVYRYFPYFDKVLHCISGIFLVLLGHYLLSFLLRRHPGTVLPRAIVLWFCWLFSAASAGVWEIIEFSGDSIFGLDCQLRSFGGLVALIDTMTDIICGCIGATLMILAAYLYCRKKGIVSMGESSSSK